MKRIVYLVSIAILTMSLIGCNREPGAASADSTATPDAVADKQLNKEIPEAKVMVPAGTRLRIALTDAVSSDKSRPGDSFLAVLDDYLTNTAPHLSVDEE